MRVLVLRVASAPGKAVLPLATSHARRLFSSSSIRAEEDKAPKGIPLALDLDGIHIPKSGQGKSAHLCPLFLSNLMYIIC